MRACRTTNLTQYHVVTYRAVRHEELLEVSCKSPHDHKLFAPRLLTIRKLCRLLSPALSPTWSCWSCHHSCCAASPASLFPLALLVLLLLLPLYGQVVHTVNLWLTINTYRPSAKSRFQRRCGSPQTSLTTLQACFGGVF